MLDGHLSSSIKAAVCHWASLLADLGILGPFARHLYAQGTLYQVTDFLDEIFFWKEAPGGRLTVQGVVLASWTSFSLSPETAVSYLSPEGPSPRSPFRQVSRALNALIFEKGFGTKPSQCQILSYLTGSKAPASGPWLWTLPHHVLTGQSPASDPHSLSLGSHICKVRIIRALASQEVLRFELSICEAAGNQVNPEKAQIGHSCS